MTPRHEWTGEEEEDQEHDRDRKRERRARGMRMDKGIKRQWNDLYERERRRNDRQRDDDNRHRE